VAVTRPTAPLCIGARLEQAQAVQQRVDANTGNRQHGNLTQRIETAEVHQDNVHHVLAAAARHAVVDEESGNVLIGPGQHRIDQRSYQRANPPGQQEIAQAAQAARFLRGIGRHEEQGKHQQHHAHHLD